MQISCNKGELFSLMREIEHIIQFNPQIPARLDVACTYVTRQNKKNLFILNEEVKAINDQYVNKNEDGSLRTIDKQEGEQTLHMLDVNDKEAHKKAIEDLMMQPVLIKVQQIQTNDLGHIIFNKQVSPFEAFKRIMINGMD